MQIFKISRNICTLHTFINFFIIFAYPRKLNYWFRVNLAQGCWIGDHYNIHNNFTFRAMHFSRCPVTVLVIHLYLLLLLKYAVLCVHLIRRGLILYNLHFALSAYVALHWTHKKNCWLHLCTEKQKCWLILEQSVRNGIARCEDSWKYRMIIWTQKLYGFHVCWYTFKIIMVSFRDGVHFGF